MSSQYSSQSSSSSSLGMIASSVPSSASLVSSSAATQTAEDLEIQQLELRIKQKKKERELNALPDADRPIREMEFALAEKKQQLKEMRDLRAVQEALEATRLMHETFEEHPNTNVRDCLKAINVASNEFLCENNKNLNEVENFTKEVPSLVVFKSTVPLDDNDQVLYTKEEMIQLLHDMNGFFLNTMTKVIDLVHTLDIRGKDIAEMEQRLAIAQTMSDQDQQEMKKRKVAHGKRGCECTTGCDRRLPGSSCGCFTTNAACTDQCKCKGSCRNPTKRPDNVDVDMTSSSRG